MKTRFSLIYLLLTSAACLCLPACINLKPARNTAHYFLLSPMAETGLGPSTAPVRAITVGIGKVKVPDYLLRDPMAVRQGANQIEYLENALWAERLDNGIQRVFADDLARLLATDRLRISAWRKEDVQIEIYISIDRFDVDAEGQGELSAWWRILSPGGERVVRTGQFHKARKGLPPNANAGAAVATLSLLVEDLSREVAKAAQP